MEVPLWYFFKGQCNRRRIALCYATFNRWNDERNVNGNRNDNDWNDNWSFAGVPTLSSFLTPPVGGVEFC